MLKTELVQICKKYGLKSSGNKTLLESRINDRVEFAKRFRDTDCFNYGEKFTIYYGDSEELETLLDVIKINLIDDEVTKESTYLENVVEGIDLIVEINHNEGEIVFMFTSLYGFDTEEITDEMYLDYIMEAEDNVKYFTNLFDIKDYLVEQLYIEG